jgi:hypothetical protein
MIRGGVLRWCLKILAIRAIASATALNAGVRKVTWPDAYNPNFSGRNQARHKTWISEQTAPVIDGMNSTEKMAEDVIHALSQVWQ